MANDTHIETDAAVKSIEDQVRDIAARFANRIGSLLVKETVNVIDQNNVRASGDLRKSITYEIKIFGTFITITVFSPLNYAIYAHNGRAPGKMPPIEPIARWVRQKGIAGRYSVKSHRRMGSALKQYNEDIAAAFVIARAIGRRGTKGVKFFDLALKQARPKIPALINQMAKAGA